MKVKAAISLPAESLVVASSVPRNHFVARDEAVRMLLAN
jgi:hypothetical protein